MFILLNKLITVWLFFLSPAFAVKSTDRPDILSVSPIGHPELSADSNWPEIKVAHVEVVAELLGAYPGVEIYVLGRDAELFFDTAKSILNELHDEKGLSRIHLLTVSRYSLHDSNLLSYLNQEGISESEIKKGKKYLFFDTGFSGSIPFQIISKFFSSYVSSFNIRLLCSRSEQIQSSWVFLQRFGEIHGKEATYFTEVIDRYEEFPKFVPTASRYLNEGGQWVPDGSPNTSIDPDYAREIMEDIRVFTQSPEILAFFQSRRGFWERLSESREKGNQAVGDALIESMRQSDDPGREGVIRDALEYLRFSQSPLQVPSVSRRERQLFRAKRIRPNQLSVQKLRPFSFEGLPAVSIVGGGHILRDGTFSAEFDGATFKVFYHFPAGLARKDLSLLGSSSAHLAFWSSRFGTEMPRGRSGGHLVIYADSDSVDTVLPLPMFRITNPAQVLASIFWDKVQFHQGIMMPALRPYRSKVKRVRASTRPLHGTATNIVPLEIDKELPPGVVHEFSNLCLIYQQLYHYLSTSAEPQSVEIVLDVDDTLVIRGKLIQKGQYVNDQADGARFVKRACAAEILKLGKIFPVRIVISSAHPIFSETLFKLSQSGLLDLLQSSDQLNGSKYPATSGPLRTSELGFGNLSFFEFGNIVSAKLSSSGSPFFDFKSASAILGTPEVHRNQIKTIFLVDDSKSNHEAFFSEMRGLASRYFPQLKSIGLLCLRKTKDMHFEKSFLEADQLGEQFSILYHEAYSRVAPIIMGAVHQFLLKAQSPNSELYFLARDGLGGFEVAKQLFRRFQTLYPALTEKQLHYIHLNKDTLQSSLAASYLAQEGLSPGKTAYFFDIGWGGSTAQALRSAVQGLGGNFGNLYLVFSHEMLSPWVDKFIPIQLGSANHPFMGLSNVRAVHFMEDSFAGFMRRSSTLIRTAEGIIPSHSSPEYEGESLQKRAIAIRALIDAASDIVPQTDLESINGSTAKLVLYPFLESLNVDEGRFSFLGVSHEK